ncbi:MAG: hypothetical protein OXQ29_05065, partial [Rhodospirillaceae bacterium]|nr:hypothetical protein [Rhodospirillaceae bacterium]
MARCLHFSWPWGLQCRLKPALQAVWAIPPAGDRRSGTPRVSRPRGPRCRPEAGAPSRVEQFYRLTMCGSSVSRSRSARRAILGVMVR